MATEKRDPKEIVSTDNDTVSTDTKISRRGLLTKAAMGVPLALTLAHKPAFGAACSISGFQSVNPSGVSLQVSCNRGYSPGAWGNPDAGNGQGSRSNWNSISAYPNRRTNTADPAATKFYDLFDRRPMNQHYEDTGNRNTSLHDVIKSNSAPAKHAAANLLNAHFFPDFGIAPDDVIGLYRAFYDRASVYITTKGTKVNMAEFDLIGFFDQYH
jgi:hypothetical protein